MWCEGTQNPYYLKNDFRGVNKVGDHKYIFLTQDKRVNNGEHFYLLNGLAVQLDEEQKEQKEKLIAFVIVGNPRHSSTWKEMREEFLGDHAYPAYCPMGSIRYDAYSGIIKTNQKSENRNNVMHMSSGPLESLLEEMLWMQIPMENSVLGKTLFDSGFSKRDISNFLLNPTIRKQNETIDLFSLTEKMDMEELIDTLRTIRRYEKLPV